MERRGWWRTIVMSAVTFFLTTSAFGEELTGSLDNLIEFSIPAGDARTQLNQFSIVSGVQMIFGFDAVGGFRTAPVRGRMKPLEALAIMLEPTDLTYDVLQKRTVSIAPRKSSRSVASVPKWEPRPSPVPIPHLDVASEVVTISSHVPALARQNAGTAYILLSQQQLQALGVATVPDVIRTLPQVFGGGPTEDTELGAEASTNPARGSGINLRGLGASSTLVLLNGRRLAPGGSEGLWVDVATLPLAAVQQIEILPDASSTRVGTDAAGGIANFIMRDRMDGVEVQGLYGGTTDGAAFERSASVVAGGTRGAARGLLALDVHERSNLPAAQRERARSDLTAWGGNNWDVPQSVGGTILLGAQTWAIPHRPDDSLPSVDDFHGGTANLQNRYASADLLPSQTRWTLFASGQLPLANSLSLSLDGLFSRRTIKQTGSGQPANLIVPTTNPFYINPTGVPGPVRVAYNFLDDIGPLNTDVEVDTANTGAVLSWQLTPDWKANATLSYAGDHIDTTVSNLINQSALARALSDPNPSTALNVFGGPGTNIDTLNALRATAAFRSHSNLTLATVLTEGTVTTLPAGELELSFGAEYRDLKFDIWSRDDRGSERRNQLSRSVGAGFAEIRIPLISPDFDLKGLKRLDVFLGERFEHYNDFGSTSVSRFGLEWSPSSSIRVRAAFSESFRPPALTELDESSNVYTYLLLPDARTGTLVSTLLWAGNNRDLSEERARTWTVGLDLVSSRIGGAALAVTYFDTLFKGRLSQPTLAVNALNSLTSEALVTRDPSPEYRDMVCSRAPQAGSANGCHDLPITAIVDLRVRNDAVLRTRGVDLLAEYPYNSAVGQMTFSINATHLFDFATAASPAEPLIDEVSTQNHPIDLKVRASAQLRRDRFNLSAFVNYSDGYRDTASSPNRKVDSWTTLDLSASMTLPVRHSRFFENTTVSFSLLNALDAKPPFLNNAVGIGYDQENADYLGRTANVRLRKEW